MNKFLFLIGLISTTIGLVTLFAPNILDKMGKFLNQFYVTDAVILAKRIFFGLLSLGVGIMFIFLHFVIF